MLAQQAHELLKPVAKANIARLEREIQDMSDTVRSQAL